MQLRKAEFITLVHSHMRKGATSLRIDKPAALRVNNLCYLDHEGHPGSVTVCTSTSSEGSASQFSRYRCWLAEAVHSFVGPIEELSGALDAMEAYNLALRVVQNLNMSVHTTVLHRDEEGRVPVINNTRLDILRRCSCTRTAAWLALNLPPGKGTMQEFSAAVAEFRKLVEIRMSVGSESDTSAAANGQKLFRTEKLVLIQELMRQAGEALGELVNSYDDAENYSGCHPRSGFSSTREQVRKLTKALGTARI